MVTVRFYGALKQFGTQFKLEVRDTAEVLRALTSQIKGLRQHLQQGAYKVRIGKNYIDNREVEQGLHYQLKDGDTVSFTPVVKGAKSGGVFQAVLGVVMIAAAYFSMGTSLAAYSGIMGAMGASMLLGGVAQMLTKTPSMNTNVNETDKKSSTSFNGIQNMAVQGNPVPLAYGRILVGSVIISQGVETYDVEEAKQEIEKKKKNGFTKG